MRRKTGKIIQLIKQPSSGNQRTKDALRRSLRRAHTTFLERFADADAALEPRIRKRKVAEGGVGGTDHEGLGEGRADKRLPTVIDCCSAAAAAGWSVWKVGIVFYFIAPGSAVRGWAIFYLLPFIGRFCLRLDVWTLS